MNTAHHRSPEQIQTDIQRTRGELDRTLTALERRLEPRRLVDQGVDYLRDNGAREYLSNLGQAAKEQPLPLALVGVGLAWMMMTNGRSRGHDGFDGATGHASSYGDDGDGLRSRASELGGKVSDAASQVMNQTRDVAHRTSQGFSNAADAARARAAQVSDATRQGAQKLRTGYDQLVNEQPLALGAIGLALGAVLAATAPRTRQEDEWMGGPSDRLMDDARRAGEEKLDAAQDALSEAMDSAGDKQQRDEGMAASRTADAVADPWTSAPPRHAQPQSGTQPHGDRTYQPSS